MYLTHTNTVRVYGVHMYHTYSIYPYCCAHTIIHTRIYKYNVRTYICARARAYVYVRALNNSGRGKLAMKYAYYHNSLTLVYGKELRAIPPRLRPRMTPPPTLCALRAPRRGELPAPLPRLPPPRALDPLVCLMMSSRLISILSTIFICAVRDAT